MAAPVLLSTVGSLGDLFPVLALARALMKAGQPVRLLLGPDDVEVAHGEGIKATAFGPSAADMTARLGMTRSEIAASVFRNPSDILTRATYPQLANLTRQLQPHVDGCRAVAHTALAMAAPLAAERAGCPHIPLLLQPTMLQSALDPPRVPGLSPPMVPRPGTALTRGWNRAWLKVVALEMRRRHGRDQNDVRRDLNLPPTKATPLFGHPIPPLLRLGLWDPLLSPLPADADDVAVTGFARLSLSQQLPPSLERFLAAGPPPMVITLGSVAHELGGPSFWRDAVALARNAGLRSVLLSGDQDTPEGEDVCTVPFAPHRALFPKSRVILHHGGMGTLGQALSAGKPELILPIGADQPDNAHRAARLGVARRIGGVSGPRAADALRAMLTDDAADRARRAATQLIPDGAARAAHIMIRALGSHDVPERDTVSPD